MTSRELCEACGFDSDLYNEADTVTSQSIVPAVIKAAYEAMPAELLAIRPDADTWSIAEYVDHVRETAFGNRFVIEAALAEPGIDLGPLAPSTFSPEVKVIDIGAALAGAETEYAAVRELLGGLEAHQWDTPVTLDGQRKTVGWFARHVVHDGLHHMSDVGRIRSKLGMGAATETGTVAQLSVSGGGVPKQSVDSAVISSSGVEGDAQGDRRHHGRPVQAVCLWSADVIDALQAEGHPIATGNAGENVTVAGVDWRALRPGSQIEVGSVPMLISAHAVPCAKNAQWFADRDFNRIGHDRNPGFSRLYGIPLATGSVAVGDAVVVEPS